MVEKWESGPFRRGCIGLFLLPIKEIIVDNNIPKVEGGSVFQENRSIFIGFFTSLKRCISFKIMSFVGTFSLASCC
jgi:hypothetical protein